MAQLKQLAQEYKPIETKNVTELESVSVDLEVKEKTAGEGENTFTYKYIEVGGEEYRIGASVLKQLKAHLEENPDLKKFKVTKEGTGLKTSYTVIPMAD